MIIMDSGIWRIETALDQKALAVSICREAVERRLAACVQMEAPMTSYYQWKEQAHSTTEIRLVFKTSLEKRDSLLKWLKEIHPYEVPEIIAWAVDLASEDYAEWVRES